MPRQESPEVDLRGISPQPSVEEQVISELKRMKAENSKRRKKRSGGRSSGRARDERMRSHTTMKDKNDSAAVLKILRSFGTRRRTASDDAVAESTENTKPQQETSLEAQEGRSLALTETEAMAIEIS